MWRSSIALAVLLALAGCRDRGIPGEKRDPEYAKKNLLAADPTPKIAVNADLGGKLVYLGADVDKTELKPGEKLTIVHYWKVVQPPGEDYRVFTHVRGQGKDWMNVDATKMRSAYPMGDWKAGDLIRDEQTVTLKGDWASPVATLHVGVYRKGGSTENDRLAVVSGPNDGHRGVLVTKLAVSGAKVPEAPKAPGPYTVWKTGAPLVIDGKDDEAAWASAPSTGGFVPAEGSKAPAPASAKLLWDDKHLYVFATVADTDVFSPFEKPDDTLWKADVVELFIDADKSGRGYVELQVNPNNAQFDSWFATTRAQPGDVAWTSGIVSAVVVDGTAKERGDTDKGWSVEMAIPLAAVKGKDAAMAVAIPPRPGDTWKLNVVRVDVPKDGAMMVSAWAPITMGDFHAIDRLVTITFGDEKGQTGAAPAPAAPAPAAPAAPAPAAPAAPTGPAGPIGPTKAPAPKSP